MHEAYESSPILEKLPLKIESIACYEALVPKQKEDILLVGTKEGHLLQYRAKEPRRGEELRSDQPVSLERSNKSFSKKPIAQVGLTSMKQVANLAAVPDLFILISLSDNVVSVHDLATFGLITCLNKTKGATLFAIDVQVSLFQNKTKRATLFAIDVQKPTSLSGTVHCTLRLCVAVKRKLQTFYWKNREFHELKSEFNLYEVPRAMTWCKDSICVGFKRDYFMVKVNTADIKELFPLGDKQSEPIITRLADDKLMLGRNEMSILIDADGNPTQKHPIVWSDIPIQIEHNPPYIIGVLPKYVEVRTIVPRLMIQNIDLQKAKIICQGSDRFYIASGTSNMTDEPTDEKDKRINSIQNLYAFELFCNRKFEESMQIFAKLETDPSHVIGLYPNLLPQDFRNQLDYPSSLPDLEGGELEKGLLALQEYLTQKRNQVIKDIRKEVTTMAIKEGNTTIKSKRQLSQIIDTTLLKCYLHTNDALVAPLLRLKDNNCHIEESEKILKKKEKFSELIILYEKKGLHQKALNLLMKQAARPNSPLKGHDRTVQYLQHLGQDNLALIFEYAEWVLKEHPEDGLKIFTEDLPEVDNLPREHEHVILQCDDETPEFHNRLAQLLREKVQFLMQEYLQSLPEGHLPPKAGNEPGEIGEFRKKLIDFLQKSQYYIPERLLTRFPLDGFYEERAILLGRLGRHEQALGIYVHILHDKELAEEYCLNYFERSKEGNKDVYLYLLKMYLQPPAPSSLGISASQGMIPKPDMNAALKLMNEHASKIDTTKVEILIQVFLKKDFYMHFENLIQVFLKKDFNIILHAEGKTVSFGIIAIHYLRKRYINLSGKCYGTPSCNEKKKSGVEKYAIC
ncbi:hypothetical protein KUTeg_013427 [Tegillarca granosa]|uniref:CNH domain-containing protein n=1 Tax=Tegillarca granosa TaxID=220873 RepID=A0ABQ9ETP2_TEGGR|nr:hypothetical protein KUTeg_013427 [Tegillarca granosa]